MDSKGLGASIWAKPVRNGDWICAHCYFDNFASRRQCFRCKKAKGSVARAEKGATCGKRGDEGMDVDENTASGWTKNGVRESGGGGFANFSNPANGRIWEQEFRNQEGEMANGNDNIPNALPRGLAMSRWAPRNRGRRYNNNGPQQVWTKVRISLTSTFITHY